MRFRIRLPGVGDNMARLRVFTNPDGSAEIEVAGDTQVLIDDDKPGTRCRLLSSLVEESDQLYQLRNGAWS
jgi:hypothetical protein